MFAVSPTAARLRPPPPAARAARRTGTARTPLPPRAASDDDDKRSISFAPNERSGRGYTNEDSAGQSNIFAVEPKTYVAGSKADATDTSVSNKYVATGAAMALALGLLVARFSVAPDYSYENPRTLSDYETVFSKQV